MPPRKPAQPKKLTPAKKEVEEVIVDSDMDAAAPVFEADTDAKGGKEKYYEAVGRRKESIARVRLFTKKSTDAADEEKALVTVNDKNYTDYFSDVNLQYIVESPLRKLKSLNRFKATVVVNGGGIAGQAGAIKHGIARALVLFDLNFRKKLKKSQFLMRDPRAKERRKYGLKKARKSPQWNKR